MNEMHDHPVIIFDGVCRFCNGAVNFIIQRDPKGVFVFATMQSDFAQSLIEKHQVDCRDRETFLLIKNGKCYMRTEAAFEVAKELTGYWSWLRMFAIVPRPVRDYCYDMVAKNRYKLFGKRDTCMTPTPDVRSRFVEDGGVESR